MFWLVLIAFILAVGGLVYVIRRRKKNLIWLLFLCVLACVLVFIGVILPGLLFAYSGYKF